MSFLFTCPLKNANSELLGQRYLEVGAKLHELLQVDRFKLVLYLVKGVTALPDDDFLTSVEHVDHL